MRGNTGSESPVSGGCSINNAVGVFFKGRGVSLIHGTVKKAVCFICNHVLYVAPLTDAGENTLNTLASEADKSLPCQGDC